MPTRRTFLKIAAGAGVALAGAAAWRAWDQGVFSTGEGPAYAAWKTWQSDAPSPVHRLVRAAILAANPHNTQPWRFRVTPGTVDLFADRTRNIGTIDPYLREMHIGLGCALENLLLAAPASGFACELELLPTPSDPAHVASVRLKPQTVSTSALYEAIPRRHTNRGAYDSRPVSAATLEQMQALAGDLPLVTVKWLVTPDARRQLGEQIVQATQAIIADREQSRDSAAWFRGDWHAIQERRDGLTVDAQALPGWLRVAAKVLPPVSQEQADDIWLKATRGVQVATAAAFGIVLARDAADNASRIQGGRLWQRMQLYGQTEGIAMQPLNQLSERADRERSLSIESRFGNALKDIIGDPGWHALMPFRLGYPTLAPLPSPRRHVEEVIV
jgi:nitroreductase